MSLLHPTMLKNRITDITVRELQDRSVKALLLDVDNTLTRHHSQEIGDDVTVWLKSMKAAGIRLMLVSNSKHPRVLPFAKMIGLPFVHTACKPLPFGFRRAVKTLGLAKGECMAVGDQTFTDVLGANLCGIAVVQLLPIEKETSFSFRVRRTLEAKVLARYEHKQTKESV